MQSQYYIKIGHHTMSVADTVEK